MTATASSAQRFSQTENNHEENSQRAAASVVDVQGFSNETFWPVNCSGSKCFHPSPSVFDVENIEFIWIVSPGAGFTAELLNSSFLQRIGR